MRFLLFVIFISVLGVSCQRDTTTTEETTPIIDPPQESIIGSLEGVITNASGLPLNEADVFIGASSTQTNEEGKFAFTDIPLYADGTKIEVEKVGYFSSIRTVNAREGQINHMSLSLLSKNLVFEFETTQGQRIYLEEAFIDLPSGEYTYQDGGVFNGIVTVTGRWVDPSKLMNINAIPGDLKGYALDNTLQALSPFSLFVLELTDDNGIQLLLPKDAEANVNLPIPNAFRIVAPDELPLWYFDEDNGVWIEEGTVDRSGDFYVGQVSHFTFWTCSLSKISVEINGQLNLNGQPLSETLLRFYDSDQTFKAEILTSSEGAFNVEVPRDTDIFLEVYHECSSAVQSYELGSFATPETLDPISLEVAAENVKIEGQVLDCGGQPNSNAFVKIILDDRKYLYRTDSEGNFSIAFADCDNTELQICAIDVSNSLISEPLTVDLSSFGNVNSLQTCLPFATGFDIEYTGMDWETALESKVIHEWTISSVQTTSRKFIISPKMRHEDTGEVYFSGAFVYNEDNLNSAQYIIEYPSQGFSVSGVCDLNITTENGITSYRFEGRSSDILERDNNLIPANINEVYINLVYYD